MIIEVACVCLESKSRKQIPSLHDAPYDKRQATLRFTLTQGVRILSRMSKHTFHLLQDTEDPSLVYYIGQWRSLACYTGFRASPEREEFMAALRCCEASLVWHEISETKYSQSRNFSLRLLHRPNDIFASPLVGIARCHVTDGWKSGGGIDVDWVLSCTGKRPAHKSLIGKKSIVEFEKDVLLLTFSKEGSEADDRGCLVVGEWKNVERGAFSEGVDCSQVRCSAIDLRIASPIHLY